MNSFARSKIVWTAFVVVGIGVQSAVGQYPMQKTMKQPYRMNPQGQPNYQNPNNPAQQQQPLQQQQQLSGTIDQIGSHGMVVDAMGQKWNVAPNKNCQIEVTGTGDASLLKPGMLVRFSADVDKKTGKASAPVSEVDVTSPQTAMAGNYPRNQPGPAGLRTVNKKPAAPAAASGPTQIVGTLKSVSGNEITVESPSGPVKADLSPNASVKIESSDPHLAQVGAKIEVQGVLAKPPNLVAAQSIHITLGSGEKGPGGKPNEKPGAAAN